MAMRKIERVSFKAEAAVMLPEAGWPTVTFVLAREHGNLEFWWDEATGNVVITGGNDGLDVIIGPGGWNWLRAEAAEAAEDGEGERKFSEKQIAHHRRLAELNRQRAEAKKAAAAG